jgi:hypothetical protein
VASYTHSVTLVGVGIADLREVANDQTFEVLRLLADLRPHRREPIPAWSAACTWSCWTASRRGDMEHVRGPGPLAPGSCPGRRPGMEHRRGVALELVADLEPFYVRKKAVNKELVGMVRQAGTRPLAASALRRAPVAGRGR